MEFNYNTIIGRKWPHQDVLRAHKYTTSHDKKELRLYMKVKTTNQGY